MSWFDNVDKKIKLRWMLSFYLKEICEDEFSTHLTNFGECVGIISLEFNGDSEKIKKKLEELERKDTIFKLLKDHRRFKLIKSIYEKDTNKMLYQTCKVDIEYPKLTEDKVETLLGYLYLKGYENKILDGVK